MINPIFRRLFYFLITFFLFFGLSHFLHNPKISIFGNNSFLNTKEIQYTACSSTIWKDCKNVNWTNISLPSNIGRTGSGLSYWIRFSMPENNSHTTEEPAFYLPISSPVVVYADEEIIYEYGDWKDKETPEFPGFNRTQFVKLPSRKIDFIYIHIYQHYIDITFPGPILFGNLSALVIHEFVSEIDLTLLSIFYFVFFIFSLMVYLKEREFHSFLYIAIFSLLSACAGVYVTDIKKHFYDNAKLYTMIFVPCLYAIGPTMQLYIISLFGRGYKSIIYYSFLLYIPLFFLSFFIATNPKPIYFYFIELPYICLCFLNLISILIHIIFYIKQGNQNALYIGLGTAAYMGSLIKIFFHHLGFIDFEGNHYLIGYLGFFIGLVFASGEDYFESKKKLKIYTENLEQIIQDKTKELELKNKILLEEEINFIESEKENQILKERESLFADIHDNLGGKLLDLSLQLKNLRPDNLFSTDLKNSVQTQIEEVQKGLKNRLLIYEDHKQIENDFLFGIELFLVRRYSQAERKMECIKDFLPGNSKPNKDDFLHILSILQEIVNNDLKYGNGKSIWKIRLNNTKIEITLNSPSTVQNHKANGHGYHTIRKRANLIGAEFEDSIVNSEYRCLLSLRTK